MSEKELIPHLFRTEYQKITAVLCKHFGFAHIEMAEDIASETFLSASEAWGIRGLPENPVAWLYIVAKNKARNVLKHDQVFQSKIAKELQRSSGQEDPEEIDLSPGHIRDSQLQMIFAVCHPAIPVESQIGMALRILCGFGIGEIADAFLTNKETIQKRLVRAKEKLREEKISVAFPPAQEIPQRLGTVLKTLYLLFNEGYYSASHNSSLRKDLCLEAMRLTYLLIENESTDLPPVNALMSLMCFQSSRFEARVDQRGEAVLYDEQDSRLWDKALIEKGEYFLNRASRGDRLSRYHLEAGIAYWHTHQEDTTEKWEQILQLYNHLLIVEYSPVAALNRTYVLSRANSREEAIREAEKLRLDHLFQYHLLLGELYTGIDSIKAKESLRKALSLAHTEADRKIVERKMKCIQ